MELVWQTSLVASGLHVAEVLLTRGKTAAVDLPADFLEATTSLKSLLEGIGVTPRAFFEQLIPLVAGSAAIHECLDTTLNKTMGRAKAASTRSHLSAVTVGVIRAYERARTTLEADLSERRSRRAAAWRVDGPSLLGRVADLVEPAILVDRAAVVLVESVHGGFGVAHQAQNAVRLEATEPSDEVPAIETVHLAWLLTQLNLDLPVYSESIAPARRLVVAAVSMLAPAVTVAYQFELADPAELTLEAAVRQWLPTLHAESVAEKVNKWWNVYTARRPALGSALKALDELLGPDLLPASGNGRNRP